MYKSTWLHLRFSFSLYLMPVFAFAAAQYPFSDVKTLIIAFVAIHIFLYPACNGYNSYFEKDAEITGHEGEEKAMKHEILFVSILFDLAAIILALYISRAFAIMIIFYGIVSKANSLPAIRLKRFGLVALFIIALFEGGFCYTMSYLALHHLHFSQLYDRRIIIPALLCAVMILGFYPLTQIYRHTDDKKRGDNTASMILGVNGTFIFSLVVFLFANLGFYIYFINFFHRVIFFILFQVFLSPLYAFFLLWYYAYMVDSSEANFRNAMLLNKIATACLMCFFVTVAIIENWF